MNRQIYADNAATTKLDEKAFEAMKPYMLEEYGNASQPYSFARAPKKALTDARKTIATCIGADPEEIFFTSGGSESDNWAIKCGTASLPKGKCVVTSAFEHHAILYSCEAVEEESRPVVYLCPDQNGIVNVDKFNCTINNDIGLVSIMMANNELGTIQPIKQLCSWAHSEGALFHTDAVQAVGHIPINVHELAVDMLSASAHKFNGPKGIGFLYIRKGIDIKPFMNGGAQESHHRAGTENVASIVGMATALKNNYDHLKENMFYISELESQLIRQLDEFGIKYVRNGENAERLPGLLSLSFQGYEGEALLHRMDLMRICISTGSACDSVNTQISHVLKAIRLEEKLAKGTIRISLGKNNTSEEIRYIVDCLTKIVGG